MTLELFSGILIFFLKLRNDITFIISMIILIIIWLITFFFFTKIHKNLMKNYDKLIVVKNFWSDY